MEQETILNIGAGRTLPLNNDKMFEDKEKSYFLVNIDPSYDNTVVIDATKLFGKYLSFVNKINPQNQIYYSNIGWKDLPTKFLGFFNKIIIYRFLEHVPMVDVPFFIYTLSTLLDEGGVVQGIVPDYQNLANMLLNENPYSKGFERDNILVTTEMVNEPYDPHASIWTEMRLQYFFELEGRFVITKTTTNFIYDHRDIYIWFEALIKNTVI